ncbi:hypothetical protein XENTR_v10013449 [Xenopus tropicalis]|uniref:Molecular chaperone MKKS n=1 Tax=Xenopus tropicalis TaxID=8364 RepID=A0A6I8Q5R7_XENTR|nr:McKusick-Kaufman/Bardet-Biedl syndromes putative chaperonin [Xenopus tropicalis]XP_004914779.1 McKusick-Kaufman/Bardet-Biedl syndromes putative chaperonin [Xenopus tropicalis]KAE8600904.1 hypothetical protein XENTR_v10013449 [Xenopus tropicalis]|eukprot:XP_002931783.1 PREDICTED: McKusick-Kaufman/Bardet-Biedl syndromes putative chaperonin [Xenopus tropicalis]
MSRVEAKKPSVCTTGPMNIQSVRDSLSVLHGVIMSCYGPLGRIKQVHNGTGGCVLTTSQSSALFNSFSVSKPVAKLLVASIRNHISCFSDSGLFAASLCCYLVDHFFNLNIARHTVIKVSRSLLNMCISYLSADDCACKVKVDFNSSKPLLCLIRSVVSSKPACMLTTQEADYISTLILKAFICTIPDKSGPNIVLGKSVIVPIEGHSVSESSVVPGLLIEMPEFCWSRSVPSSGLPFAEIKLALFSISLSGDLCDTGEGTLNILNSVDTENVMLDQLLILGKKLVEDRVNFLLCQKVVHPSLKQYLKEHSVVAVDRLGAALMEPVSQMTGAQPIASLSSIPDTCYGSLQGLHKMSMGSKHYIHLIPTGNSVCSFVLCNRNETSLKELMRTCEAAERVLQLTLKNPWVLLGGGCTETHLAALLRYKSANMHSSGLTELNCTAAEYQLVADCFCISLEALARNLEHDGGEMSIDLQMGHCWSAAPDGAVDFHCSDTGQQCGCGTHRKLEGLKCSALGSRYEPFCPQGSTEKQLYPKSDKFVFDCFAAKCNALQVAVNTASLILDLSYVIEDPN